METTDTFTFVQKDLQSKSFAVFEEMREKGQFCDLTIKLQNRSITAHRIVVAAGIPYFQTVLHSADVDRKEIAVPDDLIPKALESLILFAYTSKVDITEDNVRSLLVTAEFLELDQVRDSCVEFLSKRINIYNAVQLRELAITLNISQMTDSCNRYIRKNFEDFSKTDDFLSLSDSCVKEILSGDDLVVSSEEVAFEAMMRWVKCSPSERYVALPELIKEVRMIYLPLPYLIKQVDSDELIADSKPCRDIVNEIKNYHLLPEMPEKFINFKTRPRNCFVHSLYAVCWYERPEGRRLCIFTLANNKWLPLSVSDLLERVQHVVAVNGKIYMFSFEEIVTFDPVNQKWEELGKCIKNIFCAAVAVHEGKIYCFGSFYGDFMNETRFFDTQSNEWSETKVMKRKRCAAAVASLGEFIYVTGGWNERLPLNCVEKYCPSRDQWMDVAPMLIARALHGCTSINGKIYACGGTTRDDFGSLVSAEVYDPLIDKWKYISSMENSKLVISLIAHCGKIYAFGKRDVEVYDPENDKWKSCSFLPMELGGALSISSSTENDPS